MKSTGMLFSAEMVRAILEGKKTQTRRPIATAKNSYTQRKYYGAHPGGGWFGTDSLDVPFVDKKGFPCPFGQPGDEIWVRETWYQLTNKDFTPGKIIYKADGWEFDIKHPGWIPSIHMPRWASRIALTIKDIRVERVREISHNDALCEGMKEGPEQDSWKGYPITSYYYLWQSIYGKKFPWETSWVWVIEFEVKK